MVSGPERNSKESSHRLLGGSLVHHQDEFLLTESSIVGMTIDREELAHLLLLSLVDWLPVTMTRGSLFFWLM